MTRGDGVFLTWNDSRRSISLARELDVPRVVYCAQRRGPARHILATLQTIGYLVLARPRRIWYQYSFLLGAVLAAYARLRRATVVADVHTKALRREGPWWLAPLVRLVKSWSLRSCRAVLVTNPANAEWARSRYGAAPEVLPDPLPLAAPSGSPGPGDADIVFICSFAVDEPLKLITEVAATLAPHWRVAVTGDPRHLQPAGAGALREVATLTGYLPEADYWDLLRNARCAVILSTEPDCVPCGAYEAIAVGRRPVVALDPSVQNVFGDLALYSELHRTALAPVIDQAARAATRDPDLPLRYRQRWLPIWSRLLESLSAQQSDIPAASGLPRLQGDRVQR